MKKLSLITFLFLGALVISLVTNPRISEAQGQFCGPTGPCQTDADCFDPNLGPPCPSCFTCQVVPGSVNQCLPDDNVCDDGTGCTTGFCNDMIPVSPGDLPLGCNYVSDALGPNAVDDLGIACYMCEPTANGVTIDNGICEPGAGETCDNSVDCQVIPGLPCGPPANPNPNLCFNPDFGSLLCDDNDRCTADVCVPAEIGPASCMNDPITACSPDADGCCPAGCTGVVPGDPNGCREDTGAPIPGCDIDCWAPQVCGDGLVQDPETCDDSADLGDAGLSPTGVAITDEQCRDAGTAAECTACGDGIIQAAAGEECDGTDNQACGEGGICNAPGTLGECTCAALPPPPGGICVTGSGNPFDTIRAGCGNCALNPLASSQGPLQDYLPLLLLAFGVGTVLALRYRKI